MAIDDDEIAEAAYREAIYNGTRISWRYWVEQMPTLSIAEAARLMSALHPDLFADLQTRPNKNDPINMCTRALHIERLGVAEGKQRDTAAGWLEWARAHRFVLHDGFVRAVEDKQALEVMQSQGALPPKPAAEAGPIFPSPDATDALRRLARLVAHGGTAKYRDGKWSFTGIKKLVQTERAEGRKRCDEKTIRADLREAAQTERDEKRAGVFLAGLGQRRP